MNIRLSALFTHSCEVIFIQIDACTVAITKCIRPAKQHQLSSLGKAQLRPSRFRTREKISRIYVKIEDCAARAIPCDHVCAPVRFLQLICNMNRCASLEKASFDGGSHGRDNRGWYTGILLLPPVRV